MGLPTIVPMPPVASAVGLPWDVPVEDPVQALAEARRSCGDTFVVDSGDDRYLFTFAPKGVAAFYALPEERASKGMADWRMLRRKLPDEVFVGRRTLPHQLFGRDDVASYLANVTRALHAEIDGLGSTGEIDVFALTRRLGHRVGLASWGGPGAADGERFDRLCAAFDMLDGSEAFVRPETMSAVAAAGKSAEREALAQITREVGAALGELEDAEDDHRLFARMAAAWADDDTGTQVTGVALDLVLVHVASMSNLFAALGWALIDLIVHPREMNQVRDGDRALAERCVLESTRMAQRSIMARYVIATVAIDVGVAVHEVSAGATIATLLPLTNTSVAPGLSSWAPGRWNRRRLADASELAAVELVTTFGHGRHTCPAQPFSLAAMTAAATELFTTFDFEPGWTEPPGPLRSQIGGVARAEGPCPVRYQRR